MARHDIGVFFADHSRFVVVPCPACGTDASVRAFVKEGFTYRVCEDCGSLYVSPRPTREMIDTFYRESETSRFWATRFFPETAEARRALIFRPRAEVLQELLRRFPVPAPLTVADAGAGYGLFLKEVQSLGYADDIVAIEPSPDLAETCEAAGFRVIRAPLEGVGPAACRASVLTSFEVLEHLFSPLEFLRAARSLLVPNGLLVFTTLTVSGWDMQVLWDRSKSISPPHHINLLTTEGLTQLVQSAGFRVEEIATPGHLDVDIVHNMLDEDPTLPLPRYIRYLFERRGEETWRELQEFLQRNALSSHVRVTARRTETHFNSANL